MAVVELQADALAVEDRELLQRIAGQLNLLADLTHADLLLYGKDGDRAVVLAEALPVPVPALHPPGLEGQVASRSREPLVYQVLFGDRPRRASQTGMVRGAATLVEVFPIVGKDGRVIAALASEMAFLEHERQRKKALALRRAIAQVRELVIQGRLEGAERLGRLGVHDGLMVIDERGQIQYISAVAEYLYRRLGYADTLVKTELSFLDTNENICFQAMERGVCMEARIQEQDLVWIKRVIPLLPTEPPRGVLPFRSRPTGVSGAIVVVADVTEELQRERELRIKTMMLRETHHRVKNNLQTIAALLRLQARRNSSPEVRAILEQSIHRIMSIAVVHEQLSMEETDVVNLHDVAARIINGAAQGVVHPEKRVRLALEGPKEVPLPAQQATSCAVILNELIQNALEHGFAERNEGTITVRLASERDSTYLEVRDDGAGLPPGFSLASGSGLGLQIVQELVREDLKGRLELEHDGGVRAVVSFPRWPLSSNGL
jgi:two-component sensor histidine kinase